MKPFPMLAKQAEFDKIQYPVLASPKLDGIRAVIHGGQALSRKLIALPNQFIQGFFSDPRYQGLDGELIVGPATAHGCINASTSGVMSRDGEPEFAFHVFDKWDHPGGFEARLAAARDVVERAGSLRIVNLGHALLNGPDELQRFEENALELGYEGVMLRAPSGLYKHGRSTVKEGWMLKVKRHTDSEAEVTSVVEEMFNGNEAERDNLGRTKRSSAKAGKLGKGRAGTLIGKDIHTGWDVEVGSGMNDAAKAEWWAWWQNPNRERRLVKYRYFPVGVKDRPRHPVYASWRSPIDV